MEEIEKEFVKKHPGSEALYDQAQASLPNGLTTNVRRLNPFPLYFDHAQGSRKWDVDGNEFLDFVGGHGSLLLGHGHPAVTEAVTRQMAKGTHFGAGHALEVEWANLITDMIPSADKVSFVSSGTEATMLAIRIARAHTGRNGLIKIASHYHGWHDVASGANVPDSETPFAVGVPRGSLENLHVLPVADIDSVREIINDDSDIAAVIVEPTFSPRGGQVPISLSFLQELRQVTRETGIVLIFDEVVTAFRVSPGGTQKRYGVIPELTTLGKILGGGLPAGAVAGNATVMSAIEQADGQRSTGGRLRQMGTFNANPLSAAAATATLPLVKAELVICQRCLPRP